MADDQIRELLRQTGQTAITNDGKHDQDLIPLEQENVVFRQMFEYQVEDFEAELGFYVSVLGLANIALTDEYALFKHPEHEYCISFRKNTSNVTAANTGLKLLFMTTNIPTAVAHLELSGLVPECEIRKGSPVQDVIHFATPAGVAVEIWEDPT